MSEEKKNGSNGRWASGETGVTIRPYVVLQPGGDCFCSPGRYIRWVDLPVPGLRGQVHCRERDQGKEFRASHPLPRNYVVIKHFPSLETKHEETYRYPHPFFPGVE